MDGTKTLNQIWESNMGIKYGNQILESCKQNQGPRSGTSTSDHNLES